MANRNISTKTTAERLAGLLNTYYAKKTDVAAVLGTAQDTSSADTVFGAKALANEKVASVTATTKKGIAIGGTATNPTVGIDLKATDNDLAFDNDGKLFYKAPDAAEYVITKQASADEGYAATYQESVELAEAVRAALDYAQGEKDGLVMRSCILADGEELYEDDAYVQSLTFKVQI